MSSLIRRSQLKLVCGTAGVSIVGTGDPDCIRIGGNGSQVWSGVTSHDPRLGVVATSESETLMGGGGSLWRGSTGRDRLRDEFGRGRGFPDECRCGRCSCVLFQNSRVAVAFQRMRRRSSHGDVWP